MSSNKRFVCETGVWWLKMCVCHSSLVVTHFRVSLLLQVEQAKQLTHQALLRAETTDENSKIWLRKRLESCRVLKHRLIYNILKIKALVLTISFDYTVAVVANISEQLSVTQVKNTVSNTVTHTAVEMWRAHKTRHIKTNMQTSKRILLETWWQVESKSPKFGLYTF